MTAPAIMHLAVDGVVERDGALLLIEYADARLGRHWGLPGGGVEPGETLHAALQREVWEETGATVRVGRLLLVNEYDPTMLDDLYDDELTLRLLFHCTLASDVSFITPTVPDPDQLGIGWVPIVALNTIPFYPRIASQLQHLLTTPARPDLFNKTL